MKKKASMNLDDAIGQGSQSAVLKHPPTSNNNDSSQKVIKKQVPMYLHPNLHDALHTICFAERAKKTNMQGLMQEGLDLLFKERGYPSITQIVSGDKTIKL